jgi:predicted glutamine amidotransferase
MCRLLGWVSHEALTLREVLGEESYVAFAELSRIHADGWGLAHLDGTGIEVHRSVRSAATDPSFHEIASERATTAAIAHLRWASPGLPVEPRNAHPFRQGRTAFAHNGLIQPFERLPDLLPEAWRDRLGGTTDSEHYFLAVLAAAEHTGGDLGAAVTRVVRRLAAEYSASSLNAMLLTTGALHVVNCHDAALRPALPPAATVADEIAAVEEQAPYFDLSYRRTSSAVIVASSGFAQPEGGGWRRMENNSVLAVDRATLAVEQVPLSARLGRATEALQRLGADLR